MLYGFSFIAHIGQSFGGLLLCSSLNTSPLNLHSVYVTIERLRVHSGLTLIAINAEVPMLCFTATSGNVIPACQCVV